VSGKQVVQLKLVQLQTAKKPTRTLCWLTWVTWPQRTARKPRGCRLGGLAVARKTCGLSGSRESFALSSDAPVGACVVRLRRQPRPFQSRPAWKITLGGTERGRPLRRRQEASTAV